MYLARPGTAAVPRQKRGGLFCSVEGAFESKTLDFGALRVGQRRAPPPACPDPGPDPGSAPGPGSDPSEPRTAADEERLQDVDPADDRVRAGRGRRGWYRGRRCRAGLGDAGRRGALPAGWRWRGRGRGGPPPWCRCGLLGSGCLRLPSAFSYGQLTGLRCGGPSRGAGCRRFSPVESPSPRYRAR